MTAALEEVEWSAARPGRTLHPGKTRYPFYRRLRGPQGLSGRVENLVPTGIRSRTVQPVAIPTELPGPLVVDNRPGKLKDGYGLHIRLSSFTSYRTRKMNNKISGTRNKQSIGRAPFIKGAASDYRLWYASTINK